MSTQTRVFVVLDQLRVRVHGVTTDQAEAQRWVRELIDKAGGIRSDLAATIFVALLTTPGTARDGQPT